LHLEGGRAGVAGAGAEALAEIIGRRIGEADLQRAGLAGDREIGGADGAAALAVAAF
jgi:hypothetical protein